MSTTIAISKEIPVRHIVDVLLPAMETLLLGQVHRSKKAMLRET
jgi:hypothetical protein